MKFSYFPEIKKANLKVDFFFIIENKAI